MMKDNLSILHKNICCSDEGSQHMVSMRTKKNYPFIISKNSLLSRTMRSVQTVQTLLWSGPIMSAIHYASFRQFTAFTAIQYSNMRLTFFPLSV